LNKTIFAFCYEISQNEKEGFHVGILQPGEKLHTVSKKHFSYSCPLCSSRDVVPLFRTLDARHVLNISTGRAIDRRSELFQIMKNNLLCTFCNWDDFTDSFLQKNVVFIVKRDGKELKLTQQYYNFEEGSFSALDEDGNEYWLKEDEKEKMLVILSPMF
jgi:hypothetical protein